MDLRRVCDLAKAQREFVEEQVCVLEEWERQVVWVGANGGGGGGGGGHGHPPTHTPTHPHTQPPGGVQLTAAQQQQHHQQQSYLQQQIQGRKQQLLHQHTHPHPPPLNPPQDTHTHTPGNITPGGTDTAALSAELMDILFDG